MGVDGFRFDLASILNRDSAGNIMDFPQLLWELRHEPSLKNIKLISEPWDAAGSYELGKAAEFQIGQNGTINSLTKFVVLYVE